MASLVSAFWAVLAGGVPAAADRCENAALHPGPAHEALRRSHTAPCRPPPPARSPTSDSVPGHNDAEQHHPGFPLVWTQSGEGTVDADRRLAPLALTLVTPPPYAGGVVEQISSNNTDNTTTVLPAFIPSEPRNGSGGGGGSSGGGGGGGGGGLPGPGTPPFPLFAPGGHSESDFLTALLQQIQIENIIQGFVSELSSALRSLLAYLAQGLTHVNFDVLPQLSDLLWPSEPDSHPSPTSSVDAAGGLQPSPDPASAAARAASSTASGLETFDEDWRVGLSVATSDLDLADSERVDETRLPSPSGVLVPCLRFTDGKDLGTIELDRVVAAGITAGELVEHVLSQNGYASPLGGPGSVKLVACPSPCTRSAVRGVEATASAVRCAAVCTP